MIITTRAATAADTVRIHEIILQAFGKEDESDMWSYLLAHKSLLAQGDVRLALDGERPVAVTLLQRRSIRTRYGWAPGAIISLVACDPAVQRRGFGGAAVRDALARMAQERIALGILYGERDYYPRFGFAPVLPFYRTEVAAADLQRLGEGSVRPAVTADLPALTALYSAAYDHYPCAVSRDSAPPLWGVRAPHRNAVLTLPDASGYAVIKQESALLWIREAAAADAGAGRRLLAALGREAASRGLEQAAASLPPDHLCARLLSQLPSRQIRGAAVYGMAYISDWSRVLPAGYAFSDDGLLQEGQLAVRAGRAVLTQLALGYYSADDLMLMEGVAVTASPTGWIRLARDFPPALPKWSLDPFWEGV